MQDRLNLSVHDCFSTLGVTPLLGRAISREDDDDAGGRDIAPAVISYGLWQRRFGGVADIVGTPLIVERVPFTIVGATAPDCFGAGVGRTFDVAVPLNAERLVRGSDSRLSPEKNLTQGRATARYWNVTCAYCARKSRHRNQ
jgi:hypothetical protein